MTSVLDSLPIVDLTRYMSREEGFEEDCEQVKECLSSYGIAFVKDPRVDDRENDVFVDMMERYYEQPEELKKEDERPDLFYQVGITPSNVERARDHCSRFAEDANERSPDKPMTICPPGADPKWRFFWRIGERPDNTEFAALNAAQVIPARFPEWPSVMDRWGRLMLDAVLATSRMAAIGFKLPENTFSDYLNMGPHLLAPTGSDLAKYSELGTMFANVHYDLNFLTIHGRSRFPGLFVWLRDGRRVMVKVPPGCLLVQAGKQFEWLTGGQVLAGMHEVGVVDETRAAIRHAEANGRSLWRVSSTLFSHVASDAILDPLKGFESSPDVHRYPSVRAGQQVQDELAAIKLATTN